MRNSLLIATIVFFLLVNSTQLWEGKIGEYSMLTFMILIVYFLVLSIIFIGQIIGALTEKFKVHQRLLLIGIMGFVLTTSFLFPNGLFHFGKHKEESLFIARREGAANCTTTLRFEADQTFSEMTVCFGTHVTKGDYNIVGDTIYFENVSSARTDEDFFEFALIKKESEMNRSLGDIVRFKNKSDTVGVALWIIKNDLTKQ